MIDNFKELSNDNTLHNILQNKDYYKLLSKSAYKKYNDNIENSIKYTPYKYCNDLSTTTKKVFINLRLKFLWHIWVLISDLKIFLMT